MKQYIDALTNATHDAAKVLTYDLREAAIRDGWEPEVASGISLTYDGSKFVHSLGDLHKDRAFVHEYGDERQHPKATIRRYLNNGSYANEVIGKLVSKHLKESK